MERFGQLGGAVGAGAMLRPSRDEQAEVAQARELARQVYDGANKPERTRAIPEALSRLQIAVEAHRKALSQLTERLEVGGLLSPIGPQSGEKAPTPPSMCVMQDFLRELTLHIDSDTRAVVALCSRLEV